MAYVSLRCTCAAACDTCVQCVRAQPCVDAQARQLRVQHNTITLGMSPFTSSGIPTCSSATHFIQIFFTSSFPLTPTPISPLSLLPEFKYSCFNLKINLRHQHIINTTLSDCLTEMHQLSQRDHEHIFGMLSIKEACNASCVCKS